MMQRLLKIPIKVELNMHISKTLPPKKVTELGNDNVEGRNITLPLIKNINTKFFKKKSSVGIEQKDKTNKTYFTELQNKVHTVINKACKNVTTHTKIQSFEPFKPNKANHTEIQFFKPIDFIGE
jgi:hypothetical protein